MPESSSKPWIRLGSWALYDFANTVFSAAVITFYFPLYLTGLTGNNKSLGITTTLVMIAAGLVTPGLGTWSDKSGRAKRSLMITTLACITATFFLGLMRSPLALLFTFAVACFFFHTSLVFYNTLLPSAAPPDKQGLASGIGVGLGYFGVVVTLPLMNLAEHAWGTPAVFPLCALLFFLFAIPLFAAVPERASAEPGRFSFREILSQNRQVMKTLKELWENPKLLLFLGGNFFAVDAVNSTIFWVSVYMRNVFHPEKGTMVAVLMALNACAFAAGILAGFLSDRAGGMKTLLAATASLGLMLLLMMQPLPFSFFVALILTLGAFAVAGIWTAGRKALLELIPREQTGAYFGLYGMVTKISVLGSLFYGWASDTVGMREALWVMAFPAFAGLGFLLWSSMLPGEKERGKN